MNPSGSTTADLGTSDPLAKLSELAGTQFDTSSQATEALLRTISDVLGMRTTWVSRVDDDANELLIVAAHNEPSGCDVQPGGAAPLPDTFCSTIIGARIPRPLIIEDVRRDSTFATSAPARAFPNIGSYVGVPITLADGTVHGTLCASDPHPMHISWEQAELLVVLSRILATQIERDREIAARAAAEQRFHAFMNHSPVVAYMKDLDGRYVYVNTLFEQTFGVSSTWIQGRTDEAWLDPETVALVRDHDRRILASGRPAEFLEPAPAADGTTRYWYSFKFPVTDTDGQTLIGGVSADVTERRNQEVGRAYLAAIVQDSQDAIYARGLDGSATSWNASAERLYGWTTDEMEGQPLDRLLPDGMPSDLGLITERLLQGERLDQYETQRVTRDGRVIDVQLTVSPVRDPDGEVIGAATIARDVTEHNRLVAERDRLYAELQEEIARAADIQAHLLPRDVPILPGYAFAATCQPAREVGGDFFDWSGTGDTVRLTLADVTGKGMAAALLMATTRAALRAAINQPVADTISAVNGALSSDLAHSDAFVTMFHAELRPDGSLTYTDAGHGLAVILRRGGVIEPLAHRQVPVGILSDFRYTSSETHLDAGDTLIVYSDGLPDARPELALERPANVAALCGTASDAQQLVRRLEAVTEGKGARPDDLTVIVVRRQETGEWDRTATGNVAT